MKVRQIRMLVAAGAALALVSASAAVAATAPSFGTAQSFAVLGGSTVTNTGTTVVDGDVGVWPGLSITGFPPGTVTGTIYSGGPVALQAQSDVTVAYNSLAGQACDTDLTGQDLGGLTLAPGVYCFSSDAALTGTLTLDAQGDPGAVFVFQIGSAITTASTSVVDVINGGSDCNVFWQVGTSATLGTGTNFAGSIVALASITATTGASVSGRMLARNGAVTLDTTTATLCVLGCPIVTVEPPTLPLGVVGNPYTATVSATGGTAPYTFAVTLGTLPSGLPAFVLDANTGEITGTPDSAGTWVFVITATDVNGCTGFRLYTITINPLGCPILTLTPLTLPHGQVGSQYNTLITASGSVPDIYTYTVSSGTLPPGLLLTPTTPPQVKSVALAGTTTTLGIYQFTITATDSNGCSISQAYTVVVDNANVIPTLSGWAMIILVGALALAGLVVVRRSTPENLSAR